MTTLGTAYILVRPDMTGFRDGLGSGLKTAAKAGAAALAVGFGAAAVSAVSLEARFSKTMNVLQATSGASGKQMKSLSDLAIKMGKDTVFSAGDASDAMLELARGGIKPAQIQAGALAGTMTLAAAGNLEMGEAANIAVQAMGQFHLKGKQMASVAAALAGGANASSTSVREMSIALQQGGLAADSVGFSIQETTGILAAFSNNGLRGSDAGTSLKTALDRLIPTTDKAKNAMQDLGIITESGHNRFLKANGDFQSAARISQVLKSSTEDLSRSDRKLAISKIFGSDAQRAANILAREGGKGIREMTKATSDQGAAQRIARANMKGTAGAIESLKGSVETVTLQFGLMIAPYVQAGLHALTRGVNNIIPITKRLGGFLKANVVPVIKELASQIKANVVPAVREFGSQIVTQVVPAAIRFVEIVAGNLKPILDQLVDTIKNQIIPVWLSWLPTIQAVATKVAYFAAVVVVVASAILGKILPPLIVLVGWLVTFKPLVIGVVAAFVAWKVVTLAMAVAAAAQAAMTSFWTAAISLNIAVSKAAAVATKVWTVTVWALNTAWKANPIGVVITVITLLVAAIVIAYKKSDTFRQIVQGAWDKIKQAVRAAWDVVIKPALMAMVDVITKQLIPTIKFLWGNVIKPTFKFIGNAIKFVWNNVIQPVFKAWWAYITKVLVPIIKFLYEHVVKPYFTSVGRIIKSVWENGIKPTFSKLKEGVGAIKTAFQRAVDGIKTVWTKLKEAARAPVAFVVNTVYMQGIRPVVNAIPGVGDLPAVHMATGGVLPGYSPGRDIHRFVSRTGGILDLAGGESVMVPEWTRQMGGPLAVERMNKMARMGTLRRDGDLGSFGFARGGTLDPKRVAAASGFAQMQVGKPYVLGGAGPNGYDCSGFMAAITNVLRGVNPYSRLGSTATFPWAGFKPGPGEFTIGSANPFPGSSMGHMAGTLQGMNVESSGGIGPHVGPTARGWNSAGFNTFAHLGNDGTGTIWGDLIGKVKGLWDKLHAGVEKLTHMGDWGTIMKKAVTSIAAGLKDWINGKIPGPGPLPSFDRGGVARGRGSLLKNTIRPERVLTTRQNELLEGILERVGGPGGLGPAVSIGTVNTYDVHAAARAISAEQRKALMIASLA